MNILVTGAKGYVGKNLVANLRNIAEGKNRTRPNLHIEEIFEYDLDTDPALLGEYCVRADFVYHLAGVNRPQNNEEFMAGNYGFSSTLLETLKQAGNRCPVVLSSSIQATVERCVVRQVRLRPLQAGGGGAVFSLTGRRPAPPCWCTGSPTCSASGAAPTTTPWWPPFVTASPTTCPSR